MEINRKFLPEVRKCVVKELKNNGFKETEIARILRISQGMVSRYYNEICTDDNNIKNLSKRISRMIIEGYDEIKINEILCSNCINMRSSLKFCNIHYIEKCSMCSYIYNQNFYFKENEMKNLLLEALDKLSILDCNEILPEVRSNLVYAKDNASSYLDVMGFPGRISCFKGKFIFYMEPELGASRYLSNIIINLKNYGIRSVMNIKFNEEIVKNLKKDKKFTFLNTKNFESEIKKIDRGYDFIIDEGGFWIEPVIYVFGKDPMDVVNKILEVVS